MTRKVQFGTAIAILLLAPFIGYAVGGVSGLMRNSQVPDSIAKVVLSEPVQMRGFTLVDQDGRSFGPAALEGHWTLVVLGYTHCPDVCPFALANLAQVRTTMEPALPAEILPRTVFVSVDPARDPPEELKAYVANFHPAFMAATGPRPELDAFAKQIGAVYRYGRKDADGFYSVDHSAEIFLFDPSARLIARFQPPLNPARVTKLFRDIAEYYAAGIGQS